MIHKLSNVNFEIFFEFDTNRSTRGHSLKLKKQRLNTELRQHFFTDRIINSLDEQIVSSTSLNCFKNGLEQLQKQHKLMGHVQSCFGYWSTEAEPVPPLLVRPRSGELLFSVCCWHVVNSVNIVATTVTTHLTTNRSAISQLLTMHCYCHC